MRQRGPPASRSVSAPSRIAAPPISATSQTGRPVNGSAVFGVCAGGAKVPFVFGACAGGANVPVVFVEPATLDVVVTGVDGVGAGVDGVDCVVTCVVVVPAPPLGGAAGAAGVRATVVDGGVVRVTVVVAPVVGATAPVVDGGVVRVTVVVAAVVVVTVVDRVVVVEVVTVVVVGGGVLAFAPQGRVCAGFDRPTPWLRSHS